MTTEEIEKAAEEFSGRKGYLSLGVPELYRARKESMTDKEMGFKAGVEFTNLHWQEKTRWIPVEERLPKAKKEPYSVLIKWEEANDENIDIVYIFGQREIDYMLWVKCKYWKEIE